MFQMPNHLYDILKWLVIIVLPSFGTLYSGLSDVWNFPLAPQVVTTINTVCTFLGAVLCISSIEYKKGEHVIE